MRIIQLSFFFSFLGLTLSCSSLKKENNSLKRENSVLFTENNLLKKKLVDYESYKCDTCVFVSLDRLNVLYENFPNEITVLVPNSIEIIVEGSNIMKVNDFGKYIITPQFGDINNEISIHSKDKKGKWFETKKIFKVKKTKGYGISVNNKTEQAMMTKEEFASSYFDVFSFESAFNLELKLVEFMVSYPNQKAILVKGNKLNETALIGLQKVKPGNQITIYNAICSSTYLSVCPEVRVPLLVTIR